MNLPQIAQKLRVMRDQAWMLVAEALTQISNGIDNVYTDMGWFDKKGVTGIEKQQLNAVEFGILGKLGNNVMAKLQIIGNGVGVIIGELKSWRVRQPGVLTDGVLTPNDVGLQLNDGTGSTFVAGLNGYKDPATGDTSGIIAINTPETVAAMLGDKNGVTLTFTFDDFEISGNVSLAEAMITLSQAATSNQTILRHVSVSTPRLGVGAGVPTTDGHAAIGEFLGVNAARVGSESFNAGGDSIIGGRLGIGVAPTKELDVSGDAEINGSLEVNGSVDITGDVDVTGNSDVSGTLDVGGAGSFTGNLTVTPLGTTLFVGATGGVLGALDAATARFGLSVYTKAEVDALLAGKSNVGHTHTSSTELVGSPEEHSHTIT